MIIIKIVMKNTAEYRFEQPLFYAEFLAFFHCPPYIAKGHHHGKH